jgi:hypothetical protein
MSPPLPRASVTDEHCGDVVDEELRVAERS